MIPIGDDNRGRRRRPIVVVTVLLINIAVFIYQVSLMLTDRTGAACEIAPAFPDDIGATPLECFVLGYGVVPAELTNLTDLPPLIDLPIWATIFTSMFMHGDILHIASNMLFLWVFGDNIEDVMGHLKFLTFYLLSGVGAVALQVAIGPNSAIPMVGASGAISGILAAYLLTFPGGKVRVLVWFGFFVTVIMLPALIVIGMWILLQFINGFVSLGPETVQTSGVAYFAHIGGFLTGALLVFAFRDERALSRVRRARRSPAAILRGDRDAWP